jgi:hypothetical protein
MSPAVAEVLVRLGVRDLPAPHWEPLRRDARRAIQRLFPGALVQVDLSARDDLAGTVEARAWGGDSVACWAAATRAQEQAQMLLDRAAGDYISR